MTNEEFEILLTKACEEFVENEVIDDRDKNIEFSQKHKKKMKKLFKKFFKK